MRNYSRVRKGMVFWCDINASYSKSNTEYTNYKGTQFKSTIPSGYIPWLIVSCDSGNINNTTCNVVPILLEERTQLPIHVWYMFEGKKQIICPEYITTVDSMALREYAYTVSDEILDNVDRALAQQLGIRPLITCNDFTLQSTLGNLEDIISKIIQTRIEEAKEKQHTDVIPTSQIEDTAFKLGSMLEDLLLPSNTDNRTQEEHNVEVENEDIYNIIEEKREFEKTKLVKRPRKKKTNSERDGSRNVWTVDNRIEFLHDFDCLTPDEMQRKYKLSTFNSVLQTRRNIIHWLEKNGYLEKDI